MERSGTDSWLTSLPNEILVAILGTLDRYQLNHVVRVNKTIRAIAQYILEHRKKIRLCGDELRVLVLSLPSKYDEKKIKQTKFENGSNDLDVSRTFLTVNSLLSGEPTLLVRGYSGQFRKQQTAKTTSAMVENGGKKEMRRITMIEPPMERNFRLRLFTSAFTADLTLLVVDPEEIDEYAEEIKELIFGCCFMMSARNVIVAINLSNYEHDEYSQERLQIFSTAKSKIAKILDKTVGFCYSIIPINVSTGCNIATSSALPKYDWYSGRSLRTLVLDDQLRTNFDQSAFKKLCEQPLKMQLTRRHKIGGIGTVLEGRVMSGTISAGKVVKLHPKGLTTEVKSVEQYWELVNSPNAVKAGKMVAVNVANISFREVFSKIGYLVDKKQTLTVNCTIAFRARVSILKPEKFIQHHVYPVYYGSSRIPCLVWWILPDGKTGDNATTEERKFKIERKMPDITKPEKKKMFKKEYQMKMAEYEKTIRRFHSKAAKEEHAKYQTEKAAKEFQRPPKKNFRNATAIFLPLVHFEIEQYKATEFEKNYSGKIMIVQNRSIVGVGRVDRVIQNSAQTFQIKPGNADYKKQYEEVIARAESLFVLPAEKPLLEQFLAHVTHNKHARNCILTFRK